MTNLYDVGEFLASDHILDTDAAVFKTFVAGECVYNGIDLNARVQDEEWLPEPYENLLLNVDKAAPAMDLKGIIEKRRKFGGKWIEDGLYSRGMSKLPHGCRLS